MSLQDSVRSVLSAKLQVIYHVSPETTVYDALHIMADHQIGALLVIANGEVTGIVSERDYARKVILLGKSSKDTPVEEIMGSAFLQVSAANTVDDCMRSMTLHRVRHMPVLDGNSVLGVVSMGDLVKHLIVGQREEIAMLRAYVGGSYP